MDRKNIFQLIDQNYDIQLEVRKIYEMFNNKRLFTADVSEYSLKKLIDTFLFHEWKYRGTCINTDEFFNRVEAVINVNIHNKEKNIINFLETIENLIKLYWDNSDILFNKYNIQYYAEFETLFCNIVKTLEKRMGLIKREYKDRVILYPNNAPLEKVIDLVLEEDVQWELIRYVREDMSLAEKRKSLAYLATNLYIEQDSSENNENIKTSMNIATNILNNLHIRHNNKTGKWENDVLKNIDDEEAKKLCDMVYNEMLLIVLYRENEKYKKIYDSFNKKQKELSQ